MGDYGFDLGGFEDLSFDDYYGGFDLDLGSLPDFGFDLSDVDLGNLGLGSLDLGGLNFDIGGLDLGGVDLGNLDLGNITDITIGPEITGGDVALVDLTQPANYGFGDISDEVYQGAILNDPYAIDQQTTRNEFTFGQGLQDPFEVDQQTTRNEFTFGQGLQDPFEVDQQTTRNEFTFGQGVEDPFEVDGRQGSRTEDTALTGTKQDTTKTDTKTDTKKTDTVKEQSELLKTLTSKDNALLMALLGGLLGLLGKGSAPKGPVGYQGGIPKFTSVRGKPGEGTKFIQAAGGGLMDLAQGGRAARYLRGGTDGMADKIKTNIDGKQPARLSHGEFVIPADVVSHLGNGNSDAGADVLYDMMDKIRKARTGTTKQGKQINPRQYTPA